MSTLKYDPKYQSQGRSSPQDSLGGQNFQCLIKWEGLTRWGVFWRGQINFMCKINILNSSTNPLCPVTPTHHIKHSIFWPVEGKECYSVEGKQLMYCICSDDILFLHKQRAYFGGLFF